MLSDCDFNNLIYLALIFEEPITPKIPSNTKISVRYFIKSEKYTLDKMNIDGMKLTFTFNDINGQIERIIALDTWKMALQLRNVIGHSVQLK